MAKFDLDGQKLTYHPRVVADFLEGKDMYPLYVEISPSALCNHHCVFCHYNYLGYQGLFPKDRMQSLINELAAAGVKSVVFAGSGEPLLNPETFPAIAHAKAQGLDVAMSTNGARLKEADFAIAADALTWIRFSFNGGNPENYAAIHQTKKEDYFTVLHAIKRLKKEKEKRKSAITIGIQYILLKRNKDFVIEAAKTMKDCGADYFVVKYFYEHDKNKSGLTNDWLTDERIESLKKSAKALSNEHFSFVVRDRKNLTRKRSYDTCYGLPFIVYIREDGEAYTCFSYQHDKKTSLGNIKEKSFQEVWKNKQTVIEYINHAVDKNQCQSNCRHHQINSFLWELKLPSIEHVNFI
ncbi:radical SAM protein [Candidatus Omnitrophota bacterium]